MNYYIIFDDGSMIKVLSEHSFRLVDGKHDATGFKTEDDAKKFASDVSLRSMFSVFNIVKM